METLVFMSISVCTSDPFALPAPDVLLLQTFHRPPDVIDRMGCKTAGYGSCNTMESVLPAFDKDPTSGVEGFGSIDLKIDTEDNFPSNHA